jgi:hypothetical protein
MALLTLPGAMLSPIGVGWNDRRDTIPAVTTTVVMDATNEAVIMAGQIVTSDGGSHTLDTSGSSSIGWASASSAFTNAGTTFNVGVAAVDTSTGPPARAANASDVITFDVKAAFTGGGGGVTSSAWQTSVPTTGTKTIANGDYVAVCFQMTAKGGGDAVRVAPTLTDGQHRPTVTTFLGGSYAASGSGPNTIITFSDGALGYFFGSDVVGVAVSTRTWNSGSAQAEYGQLFQMPFGMKVSGLYGWIDPDADFDMVLYSDPLGTPVAEKTVSIDANTTSSAAGMRFTVMFPTPLIVKPNQPIVAAFKPGGSNVSAYYKTFNSAAHRIVDAYGTSGYGVQRTTAEFSDANSGLSHYYIGLMASAFEQPAVPIYQIGI